MSTQAIDPRDATIADLHKQLELSESRAEGFIRRENALTAEIARLTDEKAALESERDALLEKP